MCACDPDSCLKLIMSEVCPQLSRVCNLVALLLFLELLEYHDCMIVAELSTSAQLSVKIRIETNKND